MKAQARKILALIMAMVMSLSLAAPAFAASEEAPEAPEASTSAEVETEAPEAEEEGELETQAAVTGVKAITDKGNGVIEVETDDGTKTSYDLAKDTLPAWVNCKIASKAHVGDKKGAVTYRVSVASGYTDLNGIGTVVVNVAGDPTETIKLVNTAEWTALEGAGVYFTSGSTTYEVKGYVWQEEQDNGKYRTFFKLAKVKDKNFQTGDDDWKYFVAADGTTPKEYSKLTATTMNTALVDAYLWDTDNEQLKTPATLITATDVILATEAAAATTYTTSVINATDVTVTAAAGGKFTWTGFATDKTTGTFEVSVKVTTGSETTYLSGAQLEEYVKKELGSNCEVVSVVASSGNYATVTVKANAKSADAMDISTASKYHKGVVYWNDGLGKIHAALYDVANEQGGFYNADNTSGANGAQIAKGTELLGRVAVKKTDVPTSTFTITGATDEGTYWTYGSVDAMKDGIKLISCKEPKTVSYVQLVMNPKNGTKVNGLVAVAGTYTADAVMNGDGTYPIANFAVTPIGNWFTADTIALADNKDFVKKDSWTVEAGAHPAAKKKTVTEVTKAPNCQEEGVQTTKVVCTECGTVISSVEKSIPKISDPVEVNKIDKLGTAPNQVDQVYFVTGIGAPHTTDHYINKYEVTTAKNGTVTTKTTTYTCNMGFVHPELTKVETINKSDLQGAGKWNLVNWKPDYTIQNQTPGAAAGSNMFGYTVEITDSDIDDATLPLNRPVSASLAVADPVFSFGVDGISLHDMGDGTFNKVDFNVENVYASSSALPKTKNYVAVATVKNINYAKYTCLTGTATLEVSVYELGEKFVAGTDDFWKTETDGCDTLDSKKLAKAIEDKKVTQVGETVTKDIVIPASTTHRYTSGATVCDICGTSREAAQSKSQIFTADTIEVSDLKWSGSAKLPKVVVKDSEGNMLIKGIDYEMGVEDDSATDVGTYTVVVKGIGDYTGNRISKSYNIVKVAATLKKKSAPSTLTANKKKAVTGTIKMTAKGCKVKSMKGSGVSGVKVTKAGKVTVSKGLKKGGTFKVKVTAKEDKNHTAAKAVTVKIAIKAAKK